MARSGVRTRRARMTYGLVAVALASIVFVVGAALWVLFAASDSSGGQGRHVQVDIAPGSSTREIAEQLASAGVISNATVFRLRTRLAGADGRLLAGTYDFKTDTSYGRVIDQLKAGPPQKFVTVTIPEGFTIDQIAARLEAQADISANDFVTMAKGGASEFAANHPYLKGAYEGSLEGYLFPKTYRFARGQDAREAIQAMLDQFDREIARVDLTSARSRGFDLGDIVVMASIIEREAQLERERPLVSSVMYNRLSRHMLLEVDATIEYVIPGNHFRLRYKDLRTPSAYNTYLHRGLPPGPIANPGLASLQAAAAPADTKYLYYVLTGKDGSHTFTTTKAAFLVAKRKSKEVFGR